MTVETGSDLYLGLSGLPIEGAPIDLGDGIVVRPTFARFLSPLALENTSDTVSPSTGLAPAYWHLSGAQKHEVTAELLIPESVMDSDEDRFELGRVIVFVMRLWSSPSVTIHVMSDHPFSSLFDVLDGEVGPRVAAIEAYPKYFALLPTDETRVRESLDWVRDNWKTAHCLYTQSEEFRLGLDALATGQFVPNTALTMVSLWGALEAIFSPATTELRFRVSALIASYLERPGETRRKRQREIAKLYDKRSAAAHGRPKHVADDLLRTFELLRSVLVKMIRSGEVPTKDDLERRLFGNEF